MATGDLNGDGFIDIVSASSHNYPPEVPLPPHGVTYGSPFDAEAFYIEPFDNGVWKGYVFPNGTLSVEISSGDNGNGWVGVETLGGVGRVSGGEVNRDGIGAVVSFTPEGGITVMRPVLGGSSYAAQDSLEGIFGLGAAPAGTVDVLWPVGLRNRLYEVQPGERIVFPEIPCDITGGGNDPVEYQACVTTALDEWLAADALTAAVRDRFLESALRAFTQQ